MAAALQIRRGGVSAGTRYFRTYQKKTDDTVLIANAENSFKECKKENDALEIFKRDLGSFVRFYEFMSQIVDYNDKDLEKLSLYAWWVMQQS